VQQIESEKLLHTESILKEKNENSKAKLSLEKSSLADFTMIRRQWPGETWLLPSRSTLSLFAIPKPVFGKDDFI